MYLEIGQDEDGDGDGDGPLALEPVVATFRETGPGALVRAIELELAGVSTWCRVIGWEHGAVPAWMTPIEESGDGPARLVHGGTGGVRLQALGGEPSSEAALTWQPQDPTWAEPFLILTPQARWR